MNPRLPRTLVTLCLAVLALTGSQVSAQTRSRVRVVDDDATIWRSPTGPMIVVVKAGTDLEVVSEQGGWFEVVVPGGRGDDRTGFVAAASVARVVPGSPAPPLRPSRRPPITAPAASSQRGFSGPLPVFRGFAHIGRGQFTASDTFDAVFGDHSGVWAGGGAQVRVWRNVFSQLTIEHFGRTGERVFVHNGQVFRLGIPDKVSVTPVELTGGYSFAWRPRFRPYAGVGVGHYSFSEESTVAGETDTVSRGSTGYHLLGGVEWRALRLTSAAFEFQHRWVPDAFDAGAAADFDEDDLGGFQIRAKVLFGW